MPIIEISSKKHKNGKRPFKAILYKLQPPECVVNDVGTRYNKNGITFLEEYCSLQLDSIKDMSVTCSFIDDDKTMESDHGDTGEVDDLPVYDNASILGHFNKGYITDAEIDGETARVVMGEGVFDEMRNHAFIKKLETALMNGDSPKGSIEICRSENNDKIIYKNGWREKGRIPTEFIHSGWSIVLNPSDKTSTLVELNTDQYIEESEENNIMDEKIISQVVDSVTESVKAAITEVNSKNADYEAKISELNTTIETKVSENNELTDKIEKLEKLLEDLKKEQDTYWAERDVIEKELATIKVEKRLAEMNSALSDFTDEQKDYAKAEIEAFTADPMKCEINSIVDKIYIEIGKKKMADEKAESQKMAELNSAEKADDIFGEVAETNSAKENDEPEMPIY